MKNILSGFINKRIWSFFLLFFILSGCILPATSFAFSINQNTICGTGPNAPKQISDERISADPTPSTGSGSSPDPSSTSDSSWLQTYFSVYVKALFPPIYSASKNLSLISSKVGSIQTICFNYQLASFFGFMGDFAVSIGEYASYGTGSILNFVGQEMLHDTNGRWAITRPTGIAGPVFLNAWQVAKEWANMFVVLGFLVVALSFILNIDSYKKYLFNIIAAGILVNFSVLFVGLVIDASNIVIQQILGGTQETYTLIYKVNSAWNASLWGFTIDSISSAIVYVGLSFTFTFMYAVIAASLFMFAIIFIERYVALAILFILSPIALVFYAFPFAKARSLAGTWMENFLKFAFMGVIGAFFLNLASMIIASFSNNSNLNIITVNSSAQSITAALGSLLFYLIICIFFLLMGASLTLKSAGSVAQSVINFTKGIAMSGAAIIGGGAAVLGGKAALGTTKFTAKATTGALGAGIGGIVGGIGTGFQSWKRGGSIKNIGKDTVMGAGYGAASGASQGFNIGNTTQAGKEKITKLRESLPRFLGGVTPGTANLQQSSRFAVDPEDKKALDAADSDDLVNVATGSAITTRSVNQKLYAIDKLAENGKISKLSQEDQERLIRYRLERGGNEKELLKKLPHLAYLKNKTVAEKQKKILDKIAQNNNGKYTKLDEANALREAQQQAREDIYKGLDIAATRAIPANAWTAELLENKQDKFIEKVLEDLTDDQEKLNHLAKDIEDKLNAVDMNTPLGTARAYELDALRTRLTNLRTPKK